MCRDLLKWPLFKALALCTCAHLAIFVVGEPFCVRGGTVLIAFVQYISRDVQQKSEMEEPARCPVDAAARVCALSGAAALRLMQ